MKKSFNDSNLINKNKKRNNFSELTYSEMINIKGGGREGEVPPPVYK